MPESVAVLINETHTHDWCGVHVSCFALIFAINLIRGRRLAFVLGGFHGSWFMRGPSTAPPRLVNIFLAFDSTAPNFSPRLVTDKLCDNWANYSGSNASVVRRRCRGAISVGVCSLNLAFHSARAQRKLPFPRRTQPSLTKIKWLLQNTNRDERSNISMFYATNRVCTYSQKKQNWISCSCILY